MVHARRYLAAALLALLAMPALAQMGYSESYRFLKGVRERDGDTVTSIAENPRSSAINARDPSTGEGALHIVTRERDLTWLAFLLSRGARPDIQTNDGTTPLGLAAQLGWVDGAERLLGRGARVDLPNNRGETPLILAVQTRELGMVRLLVGRGADPNLTDNAAGLSALDYARRDPRATAILRLLAQPAQPNRSEQMGPTR
jgi:uncharacterized protein